ncbi:MAG TPA: RidA family protein [Candidatus Saccharimonadales bacterium]|nr:RidA family protein [Candidatus Saccharimonadales bacterium]
MDVRTLNPSPAGPFSEACIAGGLVFTSGMAGCDMRTGAVAAGGAAAQARQALENLRQVLAGAGSDFSKVVKVDLMLRRREDAAAVDAVYAEYFRTHRPARCWKFVSDVIAPEFLLEIEMVAALGG